jgi:electron transport complex protein RnfB
VTSSLYSGGMAEDAFSHLARALDRLPNGFPPTREGYEIALLRKIFSPEEAELVSHLGAAMEPVELVAERCGLPAGEVLHRLLRLAKRGLIWFTEREGKPRFRLAPFVVGIYEAQLGSIDEEMARLFEQYMAAGGAKGIMGPQPALHRVVPAHGVVKSEWILPYDDVRLLLEGARSFRMSPCICRQEQRLLGRTCRFSLDVCLSFSSREWPAGPGVIPREQALAVLDSCEEEGLVHTVSNIQQGVGYVCNCCGCCCGILRGITELGVEGSVAQANYVAVVDEAACQGCGVCRERCQVEAIVERNGLSAVQPQRCIGCGLCVTGCPHGAVRLLPRPEEQRLTPPLDFAAWERERLRNRGLTAPE